MLPLREEGILPLGMNTLPFTAAKLLASPINRYTDILYAGEPMHMLTSLLVLVVVAVVPVFSWNLIFVLILLRCCLHVNPGMYLLAYPCTFSIPLTARKLVDASNKKGKGFVKAVSALQPYRVWRSRNTDASRCSTTCAAEVVACCHYAKKAFYLWG